VQELRIFTYKDLYRIERVEHSLGMDSTTDDDEADTKLRVKHNKFIGADLGEEDES
jgi:hypothetical protein